MQAFQFDDQLVMLVFFEGPFHEEKNDRRKKQNDENNEPDGNRTPVTDQLVKFCFDKFTYRFDLD
jgi:hypothetical protein